MGGLRYERNNAVLVVSETAHLRANGNMICLIEAEKLSDKKKKKKEKSHLMVATYFSFYQIETKKVIAK